MAKVLPFPLTRRPRLIASIAQRMAPKTRDHSINRTAQSLLRYGVDAEKVEQEIKQLRTAVALRIAEYGDPWEDTA
jgi:hypothetical protein